MIFTLPVKQDLFELLRIFNNIGWIFFGQFMEVFAHFLFIRLIDRLDGGGVPWGRIFQRREGNFRVFLAKRIVMFNVFQFYGSTNVSGLHFRHFGSVFTGYGINLRDPLFRILGGIHQIHPLF